MVYKHCFIIGGHNIFKIFNMLRPLQTKKTLSAIISWSNIFRCFIKNVLRLFSHWVCVGRPKRPSDQRAAVLGLCESNLSTLSRSIQPLWELLKKVVSEWLLSHSVEGRVLCEGGQPQFDLVSVSFPFPEHKRTYFNELVLQDGAIGILPWQGKLDELHIIEVRLSSAPSLCCAEQ